ncbi:MAG: hypothetical protein M1840_002200 [Geoglossum simile]|nr:MAG: hypothetical protein M1840_002200 [Geoglossum simile]
MLAIDDVIALRHTPTICQLNPAVTVEAGSAVAATIDNLQTGQCEATIDFSHPNFLPVKFGFKALECIGPQKAEFTIPVEAPNGDAFILWFVKNLVCAVS